MAKNRQKDTQNNGCSVDRHGFIHYVACIKEEHHL